MDVTWIKIDSWHILEGTWVEGAVTVATTRCGITRPWDGTSLDRLPGGTETSCENCLKYKLGELDEPPKKRARKAK